MFYLEQNCAARNPFIPECNEMNASSLGTSMDCMRWNVRLGESGWRMGGGGVDVGVRRCNICFACQLIGEMHDRTHPEEEI